MLPSSFINLILNKNKKPLPFLFLAHAQKGRTSTYASLCMRVYIADFCCFSLKMNFA
jgi:hypothetical protein